VAAQDPQQANARASQPPFLIDVSYPFDQSGYDAQRLTSPLKHPDSLGVAYIANAPIGLESVEVKFFPKSPTPADTLGVTFRSSVRYQIDGHTVYVVTSEPTPQAQARPLALGNYRVDLNAGRVGYTMQLWERSKDDKAYKKAYNRVAFSEEGLIVTVFSDLPEQQLIAIARTLILVK